MKRIFLFLCLFPLLLLAEWESEEEDLSLFHHVNVISGHLNLFCQDRIVAGAKSLPIYRCYTSSGALERNEGDYPVDLRQLRGNSVMQGGWSWFPHATLYVDPGEYVWNSVIYIPEKNGSFLKYEFVQDEKDEYLFKPSYKGGQCNGLLSARKNPAHNRLLFNRFEERATLYLPDGGIRIYKSLHSYSLDRPYYFALVSEILPSGHQVEYVYNRYSQLRHIYVKNPAGNKTFSAAHFEFIKADEKMGKHRFHYRIATSDFGSFDYHSVNYKLWNYLTKITSNCRPQEDAGYRPGRKGTGARIHSFSLGGNLQFIAHYHEPKNRKEAKKLKNGGSPRLETDKVKMLEAPIGPHGEMMPLARFSYTPEYTDVRDVDHLLTRYFHDGHKLLKIEYFNERDQLQSVLKMFWKGSLLVGKLRQDSGGQPLFSRTFAYDEHGNVIEENFWGNLTGSATGAFSVDDQGRILGAECYRKRYEYLPGFHVPILEEEDNGLTYRYQYLPGTDLITAKLTYAGNQMVMRQFFFYDADHLLAAESIDDGCGQDYYDAQGMTEKRIRRYELDPQTGLRKAVNETYWDKRSGQEIFLKRTEFQYTVQNQVSAEAVFDANREHRYTIYTDYDAYGHVIRKTTPLGEQNTYRYDVNGNLLESSEVGSAKKLYTYTPSGKLSSSQEIDDEGNSKTTYSHYDAKGCLLWQTDPRGNTTTQTYDHFGRCLSTRFPDLETEDGGKISPCVHYSYDHFGNVETLTTPQADVVKTQYNALRKPTCITQADKTHIVHRYNIAGLLVETTQPDQTKIVYTYDPFERMTSKKTYAADGSLLMQEFWEYNAFHLLSYTDQRGLTTYYEYDGAGRKIAEIAEERIQTFAYDPLGFLESTTNGLLKKIQVHDVQGRVVKQWTEDEHGTCENVMRFSYDRHNRKQKAWRVTSQGESEDQFFHNSEGKLIKHVDPLGAVTEWQYSEVVNRIGQKVVQKRHIDPIANMCIETYDAQGRLAAVEKKDPQACTVSLDSFFYNVCGQRIKRVSTIFQDKTPIRDVATCWEYDPMGRVIKEIEADQKVTLSQYDVRGRLSLRTLPDGTSLSYTYDGIDRLLQLKSSDGTVYDEYIYEQGPDPSIIIDYIHHFRIQRRYNSFGQLLEEISPAGFHSSWEYDQHGRLSSFYLPDGSCISYAYTGEHLTCIVRKSSEADPLYLHRYTQFDPNGHIQEEVFFNGVKMATQRDLLERFSEQHAEPLHLKTHYGPSGLVVQTQNSLFGEKNYAYDPLNQLVAEADTIYNFDSFGNPTHCQVNACNQILATGDCTLDYDPNGNPIQRASVEGPIDYVYDALGRLTTISSAGRTVSFAYDPFSRLVCKETQDCSGNQDKVFYLYDKEHEIGTLSEQGEILQLKILGLGIQGDIGAAVALELEGQVFAPLHDYNGNIIALLSEEAYLVEACDIDAFGKHNTNSPINPWSFCSKRKEEGLFFFGRRFYDPSLGRWLTPDPAGSIDAPNLYLYVRNSPLNRLDLFGFKSNSNVPWSNRPDEPINIEVRPDHIEMMMQNEAVMLKGMISGVEIDFFMKCGYVQKLQFSEEETATGKMNILDHLHEIIPKDGGAISLVTFMNGINVNKKDFKKMGNTLAKLLPENTLLMGLHNPTYGLVGDLFRVCKEFLGVETPTIDRTRQLMNAFIDVLPEINPDVIWLHVIHSEAGLITKRSLKGMDDERIEKMRNHFITLALGPAAPISKKYAIDAFNLYSNKDRVTTRFGKSYIGRDDYDIQILKCLTPSCERDLIAGDHSFLNKTYGEGLDKRIDELRGVYGFYQAR